MVVAMQAAFKGRRLGVAAALVAALAFAVPQTAVAQDAAASTSAEDDMFGAEVIVEATQAPDAAPQDDFLKYDQVKVGGSISGNLGYSATWIDPWSGSLQPLDPDSRALDPSLSGKIKIAAKPATDFGVNMEFRSSWPFSNSKTVDTGIANNPGTFFIDESKTTITTTDLQIWSLYSKFSWKDSLFFSFGKQPLSWGVSKSFFQPADDIFALGNVDFADTGAEREGPVVFKAQYPIPLTMSSLYFYTGVVDATALDLNDLRMAIKAEAIFGNTELAAGGYYSYDDHPRLLLMGTTGNGDFNFFGEGVAKWGSERYFLSPGAFFPSGAQQSDRLWFSGTVGGYYNNTDNNIMVSAAYYYNGEGQTAVTAQEAFGYFMMNPTEIDRMKFGSHYAALSFSKQELLIDELSFTAYGVAGLSDLSFMVAPSFSWKFFDYASAKLGATLTFGEDGSEYTMMGGGKPSAALNLGFTLGSGAF